MSLKQLHTVLIGTGAAALLAGCSRSSETAQAPRAVPWSQRAGASGTSQSSGNLECPLAQNGLREGNLDETPQQVDSMVSLLGSGGENEIRTAVARLRLRHPKVSEGKMVNYLITVFCPTINARPGMNLADKRQALRTFATLVRKIAASA